MIKWHKSESTIRPDEVDTTSSKTTVYLRKNIVKTKRDSEFEREFYTYYEYDEAKLTKNEYDNYLKGLAVIDIQQQRADIDYIALMSGISLDEV